MEKIMASSIVPDKWKKKPDMDDDWINRSRISVSLSATE